MPGWLWADEEQMLSAQVVGLNGRLNYDVWLIYS
jgi:hypothetical protein